MEHDKDRLQLHDARISPFNRLLILRLVAFVLLVAVAITGHPLLAWLSFPFFFGVWGTVYGAHRMFLRNLAGLHQLRSDSDDGEEGPLPGVTLISPARNEEIGIEEALRSLAALDYPDLEVFVVNDHSTDKTPQIVDRLADEFPRIRAIHDPPLPEGWLGKANAIWQAVGQANPDNKWLVLTDADVIYHPKALRRAVAYAEKTGADFLSCVGWLDTGTLAEEVILPPKWCSTISAAYYERINDPKTVAVGLGVFTLVTRQAYLDSGGHSAFRGEQPEDTLLARLIKHRGGKMAVVWTSEMIRIRAYRGLRQILDYSIRKNRMLNDDSLPGLASRSLLWLLTMVLPLPLAIAALGHQLSQRDFSVGLTLYLLMGLSAYYFNVRMYQAGRFLCHIRPFVPLFAPVGGLFKTWIELVSIKQVLLGQAMTWRERDFINIRTDSRRQGNTDSS